MEKTYLLVIAAVIFILLSWLFFQLTKGYVRKKYGQNWLKNHVNKLYFWQSIIGGSTLGTLFLIYLLKWSDLLIF